MLWGIIGDSTRTDNLREATHGEILVFNAGDPAGRCARGRRGPGEAAELPLADRRGLWAAPQLLRHEGSDETVARFRTVRDVRYRYIRNFMPERPLLQANQYKERSYPVWNLLKELDAQGKLTPAQKFLAAPHMPAEELYDLENDPHEIHNRAGSSKPEHEAALKRLRGVLEKWIEASNDQGRIPEPPEVAAAKGTTKPGTNPNAGYTLDGQPPGEKKRKQSAPLKLGRSSTGTARFSHA